jgi:thiamine-phosphate pyrophosphorylase
VGDRPDSVVRPYSPFPRDRPVLCLVTDRRRLSAADRSASGLLVGLARLAADAGIHLFQIREKDLEGRELEQVAREVVAATAGSAMRIIVNDRVDVAMAAGAHGVHLPQASMAPTRVRAMTPPGFIIGRSVHDPEEASIESAAGAADYLLVGTVFPTSSKPGSTVTLGCDELARAVSLSRLPVLAIGGIDRGNVSVVARSGAAGIAAITFFVPHGRADRDELRSTAEFVQRAFDTSGTLI